MKKFSKSDVEYYTRSLHFLGAFSRHVENNAIAKKFRVRNPKVTAGLVGAFTANLHGEVSELWEAFRAGILDKPCDKAAKMEALGLPGLTNKEEEVADVIIRALDTARMLDIDVVRAVVVKHLYNTTRPIKHGGKKA